MNHWIIAVIAGLSLNSLAQAYEPKSAERLAILSAAAQSKKTDAKTRAAVDSLTAPQSYEIRRSITKFECSNENSTTADYAFNCTIQYGVDDMNDDDAGFSSVYQIFIDGTVTGGKRTINFTKTELFAG